MVIDFTSNYIHFVEIKITVEIIKEEIIHATLVVHDYEKKENVDSENFKRNGTRRGIF